MEPNTAFNLLTACVLLATALALVLAERRAARGEAWTLLRCLWPAWRFFEAIEPAPTVRVRTATASEAFGPWSVAWSPPGRTWSSLLVNAEGNLYLACASVVERLLQELDGKPVDGARRLVSYQLVQRMIEATLTARGETRSYQFRLDDAATGEPLFISEPHALLE